MSDYIKSLLEALDDEINSTKSMQEDDLLEYIELKQEREDENENYKRNE